MYRTPARFFAFPIVFFICGCATNYSHFAGAYVRPITTGRPDYDSLYYWAAHPLKHDPSDSIPKPLRKTYLADTTADVFFIYPTTFTDQQDTGWNAGIDDPNINAKTDYSPILYQASVFNEFRIYSPRYRQAHIRAYFTADSVHAKAAFDTAYADVKNAFQYYLDHYNHGRPIIISSHSQGSTHAQRLLREFFDGKPLQHQLVAAYVPGMYISNHLFEKLRPCSDTLQTGCVCTWRSYRLGYEPDFVVKEKGSGLVTNPLTWDTAGAFANHRLNKGAILLKFNKMRRKLIGAETHDGILWVGRLHLPAGFLVRPKNLHIGDINLFYMNIREDLRRRVRRFEMNYQP